MMNKKIQHPLRTIEISYDEQKPFQPFEQEMLERYTQLHNFVKELNEEYTDVQTRYEIHDQNITKVVAKYKAIRTRIGTLEKEAKNMVRFMIPEKAAADKLIAEAMEFRKLMTGFHADVNHLANESEMLMKVFTPLDNKDEMLSEIFAEYKEFKNQMGEGTGYSIDFEKYNNDEQQFMGSLTDMAARQEGFINICNRVIDRYNLLIEEVEKTYSQWEQYNDMIEMMRLVNVTPYQIDKFCLN